MTSINIYKISLLFFYWRTFPVRLMKIGGIVLGIFTLLWTLSAIFVIVFQCLPVSKVWQPWAEGTCTNLLHTEPAMAGLNIFCDIAILCLPLKPVLGLRINAAQKAFVIGTFLLGSYVVFTSCYRLAMFFKFDPTDATCKFLHLLLVLFEESELTLHSRYASRSPSLGRGRDGEWHHLLLPADPGPDPQDDDKLDHYEYPPQHANERIRTSSCARTGPQAGPGSGDHRRFGRFLVV